MGNQVVPPLLATQAAGYRDAERSSGVDEQVPEMRCPGMSPGVAPCVEEAIDPTRMNGNEQWHRRRQRDRQRIGRRRLSVRRGRPDPCSVPSLQHPLKRLPVKITRNFLRPLCPVVRRPTALMIGSGFDGLLIQLRTGSGVNDAEQIAKYARAE